MAAKLRTFLCTPNKTLLALPSVAGTLTRGLTRFARILAHVLAPQSLALGDSEYERISADVLGAITPHLMLSFRLLSL